MLQFHLSIKISLLLPLSVNECSQIKLNVNSFEINSMSDSERFSINNIDDTNNNLKVDQIYLKNESSIKIDSSNNENTTRTTATSVAAEFFFGKNIQIRGLHLLIYKINRPYNNKDFQTLIKTKGHDSINDKGDVILNPLHISTYLWTTKERFAQEHLENIKNLYL